ncbi:hypothetical protein AGOR_G00030790 [Albula goreensis]|uniref:C1q domain-containing protein n=1 Tax=Albula goreensis TaxID=1534307 RepID=A0A8T3E9S5_9TELE|nr:hypothetical protein AGOR_G00030790 [Albula goreensis]
MLCLTRGYVALWLAAMLAPVLCQDECRVRDGKPGDVGSPGRDGLLGQKGQKGEPAPGVNLDMNKGVKGDSGDQGFPGPLGVKGFMGFVGPQGAPGPQGPPGPSGVVSDGSGQPQSAFSVQRTKTDKPPNGIPVTFDEAMVDIKGDIDIRTGYFTCKVDGVYYFVFHSMSKGNLCLALRSDAFDADEKLGFCDFNKRGSHQVNSGGVVLRLAQGQRVWVEPFKVESNLANHMTDSPGRSFVFNGFLIFPSE